MNADFSPADFLTEFMLDQISSLPLERQLFLYRALASETKDKALRDECRARASEIEALMKSQRQMLLKFQGTRR